MTPKIFSERISDRGVWAFPLLFVILAFVKAPTLFIDPRFWAEEGSRFFQPFWTKHFIECILTIYIGSYQFLTNLSVFLATLVPLKYAPAVTTYLALALHSLVAFQIGLFAKEHGIRLGVGFLLIIAWVFLPATYEVWLTSTNLQWLTGVSMLLVLCMPSSALDRGRPTYLIWTALCAVSGVPATILAPLFVGRSLVEKNKTLLWIGLLLTAGALLQLTIITHSTITGRSFDFDVVGLSMSIALQTILVSFLGISAADSLANNIKSALPDIAVVTYPIFLVAILIGATAFYLAWRSPHRSIATYIAAAAIVVSVVQVFGALGNSWIMVSGMGGARYFLLGQIALSLLLALGTTSPNLHLKRLATILLVAMCLVHVTERIAKSKSFRSALTGPSWQQQIDHCPSDHACRIDIWPRGWHIDIMT